MSVKITWQADPSVTITSFTVIVSTDKGATFTTLATVTFNTASGAPNYDQRLKQFFFVDSSGNPGNIYQVAAIGTNGTSIPEFVIAPPSSYPMCDIFGYVIDAFGDVDTSIPIEVSSFGSRGEKWARNVGGIISQNPMGLGIAAVMRTIFPDNNGIWQISLIQGAFARVSIPILDFTWTFEVPANAGPINIRDLPQLRGQALGVFPEMGGESTRFPES